MELFQVFWDDQNKLFLEFTKDQKEKQLYLPDKIKRLNLKFEISKQETYYKDPPYLVSIKDIYHSDDGLSFSIDLDQLTSIEDLQIKIIQLVIFLYTGKRVKYTFRESFNMSDISVNDDCYAGYQYVDLTSNNNINSFFTQEKFYEEVKTDFEKNEQKRTRVYEKKKFENVSENSSLLSMIFESNKSLKNIEEQLKNLAVILKSMSFNTTPSFPPAPVIRRTQGEGIERIKLPSSNPTLMQNQTSSAKMLVIKEMKSIFQKSVEKNSTFSIKDILKPMSEEELKKLTLNEEDLKKKEEIAIENQIRRFKKQQDEKASLENLKKPN